MNSTGSLVAPSAPQSEENSGQMTNASTAGPIGPSGGLIRVAREGKLVSARRLWARRSTLRTQLVWVEHGLDDINDTNWLFEFSKWCEGRALDFEKELRARASRLEARKATLALQLASIEDEFSKFSLESTPSLAQFEGSTILRKGKRCDQIIGEVKRIRNMVVGHQRTVSEIRKQYPDFEVWTLVETLPEEDRETFYHPRQWGPVVGYAKNLLAKEYACSSATVTNWVKAYRRVIKKPTA